MNNNRFVFLVPVFNAEKTIENMLASVFFQSYQNWIILIRNDLSSDETSEKIDDFCKKNNIDCSFENDSWTEYCPTSKVFVHSNSKKLWEVENVLQMLKRNFLKDDDILCRLDGDDFLCDLYALQDINMIYEQTKADFVYTAHRWTKTEQVMEHGNDIYSVTFYNDSKPYKNGSDPYSHIWATSHLKTFRKHLLNNVSDENYRGKDGEYIKRAGDRAIIYPALYNAKKVVFFPKAVYSYTIDPKPELFQSEDSKFQFEEAQFLISRGYVKK